MFFLNMSHLKLSLLKVSSKSPSDVFADCKQIMLDVYYWRLFSVCL